MAEAGIIKIEIDLYDEKIFNCKPKTHISRSININN
jgi:hypothetical protein